MASFTGSISGLHDVIIHSFKGAGNLAAGVQTAFTQDGSALHRVANTAQDVFELYRGTNQAPDFNAAPFETFASLPHTTAVLTGGPVKYFFVLRKRNPHNLLSQNIRAFILELDGSDDQVTIKPSNAQETAIAPALAGAVRLTGLYFPIQDKLAARADTFLVYLTSDGSNPDPGVDTPTEVTMVNVDGTVRLNHVSATFADGLTIKAIIRTRKQGTPDLDSDSLAVLTTTSDTDGPTAPDGAAFFNGIAEQNDV